MNKQRYTETASAIAIREARVIRNMLADLDRTICLLDGDIAAEEERSQIFEIFDPRYSLLARTLVARRDNVKVTVATLARRLRAITAAIPKAIPEAA
ncbi:hypothetical protein [Bradyrhizobium sp. JYMT SZCCT0428]|uniref:hypothetical protein n=1 Tax=Bradyrhizobium sp. JYMT SZCCT0428 TaxID=2807673 RepID=UPI001BA72144|nr:hypothetical protein [Bradyrhizobium sp. JYMT SZCCT0428]MBR1157507.1 hypothetical protein [Bradyrhizobium sp. JYMT SZCCT0428]